MTGELIFKVPLFQYCIVALSPGISAGVALSFIPLIQLITQEKNRMPYVIIFYPHLHLNK